MSVRVMQGTLHEDYPTRFPVSFFMLDEERNACRVIKKNPDGSRLVYDFSQFKGATIEADLLERDFTINAMAVDLSNPGEIIDPLKGGRDLFGRKMASTV